VTRVQLLAARAQGPLGVVLVVVAVAVLAGAWWAVGTLGAFLLVAAVVDAREPAEDDTAPVDGY
jgi:hypothetical protein